MEVYAGLVIFFISISIRIVLIYFHWYLKSDTTIANINPGTETIIYWMCKWKISNELILNIVNITFLMTWLMLKTLIQAY